jgi:hypothetical protein
MILAAGDSHAVKMMTGELAPARHIPSAATVAGNLDQIDLDVSPVAASTTSPICSR